ncbi:MAG: DPP IV N-terminal domain-containing protein [Vulcanimicrobiaceae bacterium]
MMRRLLAASSLLLFTCAAPTAAAPLDLNVDTVFATQPPWGALPSRIVWSPDSRSFLYVLPTQDQYEALAVHQYDVATGAERVLIDPEKYGKQHPSTPAGLAFSPDAKQLAFTVQGTLYTRDLATGIDRKIADRAADAQWSPKSNEIAYVHDSNLYVASLGPTLHLERITTGGRPNEILNGELDWVYPEELSTEHGFAWAPDASSIAYMQMDERAVTAFPIVDFLTNDQKVANGRYPLAGEKNPKVALHVVELKTLRDRVVYDAGAKDEYLPFFGWRPNTHELIAELLDRDQQNLRVVAFRDGSNVGQTLYEQHDAKWVDDIPLPAWLAGGDSVWVLDRDGTTGVFARSADGSLRRITGSYHVERAVTVDVKARIAYVTAAYPTRRDRSLLAVAVDGGATKNLTPAAGAHAVSLAPDFSAFVDTASTLNSPPHVDLLDVNADRVRVSLAATNTNLARALLPADMLEVDSQYGPLDAWMIKPPEFDAHKRYPVIMYVYGGPSAPTTANAFGNQTELYHQLLARKGFIVFSIDGPASQIDSDANVRLLYHNFGPGSLLGQKLGVGYLKSLSYVDPNRIGIWGWSFGGYETIYALTHSSLFKAGAAVAPVTDWHLYDTIYTERYMGSPQNDPKAYDASSNLTAAADLHGDLVISHGTSDDNVHIANSISMLQRFIDADKPNVDFYVYPRRTHSISGVAQRRHLFERMLDFWTTHL